MCHGDQGTSRVSGTRLGGEGHVTVVRHARRQVDRLTLQSGQEGQRGHGPVHTSCFSYGSLQKTYGLSPFNQTIQPSVNLVKIIPNVIFLEGHSLLQLCYKLDSEVGTLRDNRLTVYDTVDRPTYPYNNKKI